MSILIKGIELPEKVQVLELHHDGKVFTRKGYLVGEAVELPDHHGRLVDADATIKEIKARNPDDVSYEDAWAITCIEHATTIVEAEGENADHE